MFEIGIMSTVISFTKSHNTCKVEVGIYGGICADGTNEYESIFFSALTRGIFVAGGSNSNHGREKCIRIVGHSWGKEFSAISQAPEPSSKTCCPPTTVHNSAGPNDSPISPPYDHHKRLP